MHVRTTIKGIMGVIATAGVSLADLRTFSSLWASALFTLAFLATAVAAIGAIATHGRDRATWGGYAVACGLYLWVAFYRSSASGGLQPSPLLTTLLFVKTADAAGDPAMMVELFDPMPENVLDNESAIRIRAGSVEPLV